MKIAFDATVLHGPVSGIGYYCQELLAAMANQSKGIDFFAFSHMPVTSELRLGKPVRYSDSRFCPVRAAYMHALLPSLLRKELPDLCHYTNFLAPVVDATPFVVTIHDMGLESLRNAHPLAKRMYTRRLVPYTAKRARLIITNSEFSKWQIVRYLGVSEDRIRVTPLAASADFHPVDERQRAAILQTYRLTSEYFLYVGNIEPRKNVCRLLKAFASLPDKERQLAVVGNSWYRAAEVRRTAEALGLNGRIRFTGYVPRHDLAALYSGAIALVYPSLLEGFGLPVVEAMACGTPVITSNNSSLKEISGDAALLIDPVDISALRDSMADVTQDRRLRLSLVRKGLQRAAGFSWRRTAALTLDAYSEAVYETPHRNARTSISVDALETAVHRTLDYAALFQFPLTEDELHERLFDVAISRDEFGKRLKAFGLPRVGEYVSDNRAFVQTRSRREDASDRAIKQAWPALRQLAGIPFVRMIAFSGATAHRNMDDVEDLDLFLIVEDGKLWAAFLSAVIWAKATGRRRKMCMNYWIADSALPLFEFDRFTAQQVASLKPIYGKSVYDAFIRSNPFVTRHFPNFAPSLHRQTYPELAASGVKPLWEALLRRGPVQILERFSHWAMGAYLRRKLDNTGMTGGGVALDSRRLKLHFNSHKGAVLLHADAGALAPTAHQS